MVRYMTDVNMLRWFRCDLELGCSKHVTGNECLTYFITVCFQIDQAANKRVQRFPWQPEIYWSEQIRPQGWRWFGTKIKIWFYNMQIGYLYQFPYLNVVINHLIWPIGWTSQSIFSTRETRADLFSLDSKLWKNVDGMTNKLRQTFSCFELLANADLFVLSVARKRGRDTHTRRPCLWRHWYRLLGKKKEREKKRRKKEEEKPHKKQEEHHHHYQQQQQKRRRTRRRRTTTKTKKQQYSQLCFRDFQTWIFNQPDQTWSEKSAVWLLFIPFLP